MTEKVSPSQEFIRSRQTYGKAFKTLFAQRGMSRAVPEETQRAYLDSANIILHIGEFSPLTLLPPRLQLFADEAFQESFDVGTIILSEKGAIFYSKFRGKARAGRDSVPNRIEFKFAEADSKISSFVFVFKPGNTTYDASGGGIEIECSPPILDEITSMIRDLANMQNVYYNGSIRT
ncbi:MAG: hypothetical protein M1444_00160 [Patescibacteria group bacterium]|nr:hypothetical protein [Patescibacteria group bacterium]